MAIASATKKNLEREFSEITAKVKIFGKPVLVYTAAVNENPPEVEAIEIMCHKSWKNHLDGMIKKM